jgi:hypothetical protein
MVALRRGAVFRNFSGAIVLICFSLLALIVGSEQDLFKDPEYEQYLMTLTSYVALVFFPYFFLIFWMYPVTEWNSSPRSPSSCKQSVSA